jgi:hypothetical protein
MISPKPWTADEEAILRARYVADGPKVCAEALGRSWLSVTRRAQRLRLVRVRRWSEHDDAHLMVLWGVRAIAKVAKLLGRTPDAVYERARQLGLGLGCPRGAEYLTTAARRTGYAVTTLRMILRWGGVRIERATTRPSATRRGKAARKAHLTHVVEPCDVDDAVARWCATEALEMAAESRSIGSATLARLLREATARGDARIPAKPRGFRKHWRIPSLLVDELVTAYARRESLAAAAMRIGVQRTTLHAWLTRAGVPVVRVEKLDPDAVDRVVAGRLADPRCKAPARRIAA